jgi:two-component system, response regulator YesN
MYNVLIADDERIIREGIRNSIDWESLGLTLCGIAKDGLEAYDLIKSHAPNIVITDIKMPGMDGLELISKVHKEHPEVVFIILSGYGEFEFANKAMKFGVKHYLLKPCDEDEILPVLQNVLSELKEKEEKDTLYKHFKRHITSGIGNDNELKDISQVYLEVQERLKGEAFSGEQNYDKYSKIIKTVIDCVRDNIGNPQLSLNWIAKDVLYMNENYLGKLFHKETNKKFSHYVAQVRMEKAKELIERDRDFKIYEITEQVGFESNTQYFSQVFKKYTGYTPSEYKKLQNYER